MAHKTIIGWEGRVEPWAATLRHRLRNSYYDITDLDKVTAEWSVSLLSFSARRV